MKAGKPSALCRGPSTRCQSRRVHRTCGRRLKVAGAMFFPAAASPPRPEGARGDAGRRHVDASAGREAPRGRRPHCAALRPLRSPRLAGLMAARSAVAQHASARAAFKHGGAPLRPLPLVQPLAGRVAWEPNGCARRAGPARRGSRCRRAASASSATCGPWLP